MESTAPSGGHPLANGVCSARALADRVYFEGGRIDALVACEGTLLRTAQPDATHYGLAQVRRRVETRDLAMVHVLFAPIAPRPLLLGLVCVENASAQLLQLAYTELWEVQGTNMRAAEGACVCDTPGGRRALADASSVIRGRPPDPLPRAGLALELRISLPPGGRRQVAFAYAAPEPREDPSQLVRAWRADVAGELVRTVRAWRKRLRPAPNTVEAYRVEVLR